MAGLLTSAFKGGAFALSNAPAKPDSMNGSRNAWNGLAVIGLKHENEGL